MSWIFTGFLAVSCLCAAVTGQSSELAASVLQGAQSGITLSVSIAGSLCLWTGFGKLLEQTGATQGLSRLLGPALNLLFPTTRQDPQLAGAIGSNICANFLGLGNAATPMGIRAVQRMSKGGKAATDEMCALIVLNTASIQLIPANVAAIRSGLGCAAPFDILPMVWITSLCSASAGLIAAGLLGKLWAHD